MVILCPLYNLKIVQDIFMKGFQVIEGTKNYHCGISKGYNSKIVLTRVTVLVLSMSSDDALYFYEVSLRVFNGF